MSAAAVATTATRGARIAIHRSISSIRHLRQSLDPSVSVGFVPTMGALHDGHLSLIRKARDQNDVVVASVFVNPTQFGPNEDLDKYPRQLERDTELLEELGVDHLFAPTNDMMYTPNHATFVTAEGFEDIAEGKSRPGHFRGVATVVTKLLNIVQPTKAYFGQKDAAQTVLIKRIVEDLNIPTEICIEPTLREVDGLAMSSRNTYLAPEERRVAPVVYRSLCAARDLLASGTTNQAADLESAVRAVLQNEPLVSEVHYVAVDSATTMRPLVEIDSKPGGALVSIAVKIGNVRLIDNILL